MTFRARLVLAATTAVVIAVVLAAVSAYLVSKNSLIGSIDDTLTQQAQAETALLTQQAQAFPNPNNPIRNGCTATPGQCIQVVPPNGDTGTKPPVIPVTPAVRSVAAGTSNGYFTDVTVHGIDARLIVYPVADAMSYRTSDGQLVVVDRGALQLTAPL
ncbi:MAG TPA: hypothetical protein VHY77_05020, partial [Acidimicrobiales bacterium]|nr:hypothetical protein [Acidimicrobiales bacterium]